MPSESVSSVTGTTTVQGAAVRTKEQSTAGLHRAYSAQAERAASVDAQQRADALSGVGQRFNQRA